MRIKAPVFMGEEVAEIIDGVLGDFLKKCMGKNDMSVAMALTSAAVMIIHVHCQSTGEDFDELLSGHKRIFDMTAELMK